MLITNVAKGKRKGLLVAMEGQGSIENRSHLREMTKKERAAYLKEPIASPFRRMKKSPQQKVRS